MSKIGFGRVRIEVEVLRLQLVLVLELDQQVVDERNCPKINGQNNFQQENQQLNQREMNQVILQDLQQLVQKLARVRVLEQWIFERKKLGDGQIEQVRVLVQMFEELMLWVEEQVKSE